MDSPGPSATRPQPGAALIDALHGTGCVDGRETNQLLLSDTESITYRRGRNASKTKRSMPIGQLLIVSVCVCVWEKRIVTYLNETQLCR